MFLVRNGRDVVPHVHLVRPTPQFAVKQVAFGPRRHLRDRRVGHRRAPGPQQRRSGRHRHYRRGCHQSQLGALPAVAQMSIGVDHACAVTLDSGCLLGRQHAKVRSASTTTSPTRHRYRSRRAAASPVRTAGATSPPVPTTPAPARRLPPRCSAGVERLVRRLGHQQQPWAWLPTRVTLPAARRRGALRRAPSHAARSSGWNPATNETNTAVQGRRPAGAKATTDRPDRPTRRALAPTPVTRPEATPSSRSAPAPTTRAPSASSAESPAGATTPAANPFGQRRRLRVPAPVPGSFFSGAGADHTAVEVAAGGIQSCAVTNYNQAWCWGGGFGATAPAPPGLAATTPTPSTPSASPSPARAGAPSQRPHPRLLGDNTHGEALPTGKRTTWASPSRVDLTGVPLADAGQQVVAIDSFTATTKWAPAPLTAAFR